MIDTTIKSTYSCSKFNDEFEYLSYICIKYLEKNQILKIILFQS